MEILGAQRMQNPTSFAKGSRIWVANAIGKITLEGARGRENKGDFPIKIKKEFHNEACNSRVGFFCCCFVF